MPGELLDQQLVDGGAAVHERGGQDGERAAVLEAAGGAEEPLGRRERGGVDAAGQGAAGRRAGDVVGAAQPGQPVDQHDDVVAELDQPLGPLDGELGDRGVVGRRLVERRRDHLALDRALEVGDLLGPLVDQDHHQVALGVVGGDRGGHRLQDLRLAGLGGRDDQAALALADRRDDVDDPADQVVRAGLEPEPLRAGGPASAGRSRPGSWPTRGRRR